MNSSSMEPGRPGRSWFPPHHRQERSRVGKARHYRKGRRRKEPVSVCRCLLQICVRWQGERPVELETLELDTFSWWLGVIVWAPLKLGGAARLCLADWPRLLFVLQAYLHSMCIIHRDLNSHNCLIKLVRFTLPAWPEPPWGHPFGSLSQKKMAVLSASDQTHCLGALLYPARCL